MTIQHYFSALRENDNVRMFDPEYNKDLYLPEIDLHWDEEDARIPELTGTVSRVYTTNNFGPVLDLKLEDGSRVTLYEHDDWKIEIIQTSKNVAVDEHYMWQDAKGNWQLAVHETLDTWRYNNNLYVREDLKKFLPASAFHLKLNR
jgi:hypothetical protein